MASSKGGNSFGNDRTSLIPDLLLNVKFSKSMGEDTREPNRYVYVYMYMHSLTNDVKRHY